MKLLKAHITSFGNIENKDINFKEGLNSFFQKNGEGKSTLASFIKAIFYGLPNPTKTNFERNRALPYSGKICSGNLTFEFEGKEYKIERTFGNRMIGDTLDVYLNNIKTDELGDVPGEVVFGYDMESFEKTVFIDSNDLEIRTTSTLDGKMGHYVESNDNDITFEECKKKLDELKKEYKPAKSAATKGLISEKANEVEELKSKKVRLENLDGAIKNKYSLSKELEKEISKLNDKIVSANELNRLIDGWKSYDEYQKSIVDEENAIKDITARYPNGFINSEEEKQLKEFIKQKNDLVSREKSLVLSSDEKNELDSLSPKFSHRAYSDNELDNISSLINNLDVLKKTPIKELNQHEKEIAAEFAGKNLNFAFLEKDIENLKKLKNDAQKANEMQIVIPKKEKVPALQIVLLIMSILLMGTGIILGILLSKYLYIAAGVGLLALLFDGFLYLSWKTNKNVSLINVDSEKEKIKLEIVELEAKIASTMNANGFLVENKDEIINKFYELKVKYDSYKAVKSREEEYLAENKKLFSLISNAQKEILEKFSILGIRPSNDYRKDFESYRKGLRNYESLIERQHRFLKEQQDILLKTNLLDSKITEIKNKYSINDVDEYLAKTIKDKQSLNLRTENIEKNKKSLEALIKERKLTSRIESTEQIDIETLQKELNDKNAELQNINKEIYIEEIDISKLEEDVSSLDFEKNELERLKNEYSIIEKTIKFLADAETSLKNKYIAPIKNSFIKYSDLLSNAIGKKIEMDADFNLKIDEEGKLRPIKHLSSGELSLCILCYRLAIIDNVFPKDKPFLVLDDIFMSLDEEHLYKAKELLDNLSKERQIIYFTCHESREVKS